MTDLRPGRLNGLTDVEGVEVGQVTCDEPPYLTGVTAVLTRSGAVAAVDVRGAAPATRETDALSPENLIEVVHGIVLSGSSAYGLSAADGVMALLAEQGIGHRVGERAGEVVPIVPAAALFDLGRGGDFAARVDAATGYAAAAAAGSGPVAEGNAGAGCGALFAGRRLKGGTGSASVVCELGTVAALVAFNAVGSALDPVSGRLLGEGFALGDELGLLDAPSAAELAAFAAAAEPAAAGERWAAHGAGNDPAPPARLAAPPAARAATAPATSTRRQTVIGVVATDLALHKTEVQRLARVAHDGLARAVRPSHTLFDGDVLFALATGRRELPMAAGQRGRGSGGEGAAGAPAALERGVALVELCELAADCVTRAVTRAVLAARSVGAFVAYGDAFPTAVARRTTVR